MIRLGFTLIGRMGWAGGSNYLRNMLAVIQDHLADQVEARLFLSPREAEETLETFAPLLVEPPIVDPIFEAAGRGKSLQKAMLTGRDRDLEAIFKAQDIDVMFETAVYYGWRFGWPALAWMPDFQHRHMPEMFSKRGWWQREVGFRMQARGGRRIMLSSETARADCETFYPETRGRTITVPFAVNIDPKEHLGRKAELTSEYGLPPRFIYLPNQFWKHKNHGLVVEALGRLSAEGRLDDALPVITTGPRNDQRHPALFDDLMGTVRRRGLADHFRYLGLIPYKDVLGLAATADHILNPSFFEGWSTPIEEAKALGTPLLLSDIPIHREQAPTAQFFDPRSPASLATTMLAAAEEPVQEGLSGDVLNGKQKARLKSYAEKLLQAVTEAASLRK